MKPNRVGRQSAGKPAKVQTRNNTEKPPGINPVESPDEDVSAYMRTLEWLRREIRRATRLPACKMIPRLRELLTRQEALSREVEKYLSDKDQAEPEPGEELTLLQEAILNILRSNQTRYLLCEETITGMLPGFGFAVDRAIVQNELRSLERRAVPLTDEAQCYHWKAVPQISKPEKLCRKVAALPPKAQADAIAIFRLLHERAKAKSKGYARARQCPVLSIELHASANN